MDGDKLADVVAEGLCHGKQKIRGKKLNTIIIDEKVETMSAGGDGHHRDDKTVALPPSEFNEVKDSGGMRSQYLTGAVRDSSTGKGQFHVISAIALRRLAKHYENGSKKYGLRNWEKGIPLSSFLNSAFRHLLALCECAHDEDHGSALAWNAFGFIHIAEKIKEGKLPKELDDIGWLDGAPRIHECNNNDEK
jgi:hypothetical protein